MSVTQDRIGISSHVLAAAADGLPELIERNHGDIDSIFGRAGLNTEDISEPYNDLDLRRYCCLFEEAARQTGNENFGLRFGDSFTPKRLGPLGYIAINSPTLASAIRNLVYYFSAHQSYTTLSLRSDSGVFCLDYQIIDPSININQRRQDAELSLGMFCNVFRHCLGKRWAPLEIHLEHENAAAGKEHEERFGCPVLLGRNTNSIVFRQQTMDAIMPDADPYLFSVIRPLLVARQSEWDDSETFVDSIRSHISNRLGDETLSLDTVAEAFDMPVQVLQRRLKAYGLTFRDIRRTVRQKLALRYVRRLDIPLTQISFALGYSEQSAFTRAFKQYTGLSPLRYRSVMREEKKVGT